MKEKRESDYKRLREKRHFFRQPENREPPAVEIFSGCRKDLYGNFAALPTTTSHEQIL